MPYRDEEARKAANRDAAKRYRDSKKGMTQSPVIPVENVIPTVIPEPAKDVTPLLPPEAKCYPAVLHALTDPAKRAKMQAICDSLNTEIHTFEGRKLNLLGEVRYGIQGPTLTVCAQWLKATETVPQT